MPDEDAGWIIYGSNTLGHSPCYILAARNRGTRMIKIGSFIALLIALLIVVSARQTLSMSYAIIKK